MPAVRALQRTCACRNHSPGGECTACRETRGGTLQRASLGREVLHSPGQPLVTATRNDMEPRFGHDFGRVRVHTNARATESERAVHALEADLTAQAVTPSSRSPSGGQTGGTPPFRETTDLLECIRIMGEANREYCREVVLGEKPELPEEAWIRVRTSGPHLLTGSQPSYDIEFDHFLPPVPTGVTQMWQVVENKKTFLTDQCEEKTETNFRIDIVKIGGRGRIKDEWLWIRNDNPCFAMQESKATVGFDDQISNLRQDTNVLATQQLAEETLGKMTGPKGTYSGVYTFVKGANCSACPDKLKEIQERNQAPNGEALTIEGIGSWRSRP